MKKLKFLLITLTFLSVTSCGEQKPSLKNFVNELYAENSFRVSSKELNFNYTVNKDSFKDNLSNKTYFKHLYVDNYQVYTDTEIINNNYVLEVDYPSVFKKLLNPLMLTDINFDIKDEVYKTKSIVSSYLVDGLITNYSELEISLKDDSLVYKYHIDNTYKKIVYTKTKPTLVEGYGINETTYQNFFETNGITYKELLRSINVKQSFNAVLVSNKCGICERKRRDYFYYFFETKKTIPYYVDISNVSNEEKAILGNLLNEAYKSEENKDFYFNDYPVYPNTLLTPTNFSVRSGKIEKVLLGFVKENINLFTELIDS